MNIARRMSTTKRMTERITTRRDMWQIDLEEEERMVYLYGGTGSACGERD